ncbi:MAG: DUF1097 family protein [Clostridia bacterium]|nr:DUF1097 family protein [Clostridia bacterium]
MKIFLKWFAIPLLIAVVASVLYIVDALIGGLFVQGGSFMWVAFAIWTIFYGATIKDRVRGLIGVVIGFGAGILMMLITNSFTLNLSTISISCLVGVFCVNFAVMFMEKTEKLWINSITGIFAGIFLTFSGLGVGLSPIASSSSAMLMLGILVTYTLLGLVCGFVSITVTNKVKERLNQNINKQ